MTLSAPKLLVSTAEAGQALGCSRHTVLRMVREGQLRSESRGRNVKVVWADVERLAHVSPGAAEEDEARRRLVNEAQELYAQLGVVLSRLRA